jgi:hypothetical protein
MGYKLDPASNPKAIDLIVTIGDKRVVLLGIYSLEAGVLRVCFADEKARPNKFEVPLESRNQILTFEKAVKKNDKNPK